MNPQQTMKTHFIKPAALLGLALFALGSVPARTKSFSEPPIVVYGKVIQVGAGASYQLFSGELSLTLVNESNPGQVITKKVRLGPVGENGAYSYRVELPLKFLPGEGELADNLSVEQGATPYQIASLSVDGNPAELLDSTLASLSVQFNDRATEHRVDLKLVLDPVDSDGDGIPDWWEDKNGLNRHYALDAAADPDGDGLSNLQEFLHGTDPNSANFTPVVKTTTLSLPPGARSGLHLIIVDQDTDPSNLALVVLSSAPGLTWFRNGSELAVAQPFSYADVLAGSITVQAAPDFTGTSVPIGFNDQTGDGVDRYFSLKVTAFSPADLQPAVWLHAGTLAVNGPIAEWSDASGSSRDAYQPSAANQPSALAGEAAGFQSQQFLYLDDRSLSLNAFTAFLDFDVSATSTGNQTLFSSPDLQLRIGGEAGGSDARSLQVTEAGRTILGPVIEPGQASQITLGGESGHSFLVGPDQNYYVASASSVTPLSTFTTIGGLQRLSDSSAQDFLRGGVRELVLFNRTLDASQRSRVEDYQRARWDGWLLWEDHDETLPLAIRGAANFHNLITGGWGDDTLTGGPLSDIIRGGPGANHLTGGGGADRFEFLPDSGNDTITDFSADAGDVIDLTALFGDRTGTPAQYVNVRAVVTRGADNVPVVNSLLELDYNGDGGTSRPGHHASGIEHRQQRSAPARRGRGHPAGRTAVCHVRPALDG